MPGKAQDNWDPNGQVVTADGFVGTAPLLAGAPAKAVPLSQYAQIWLRGGDVSLGASLGGPSNPYKQSVWVYACVVAIQTNAARVPIRISLAEATGTRSVWGLKNVRSGAHHRRRICREKSAWKAAEGEIVETGELFEVLKQPNEEQTFRDFMEETIVQLYCYGRVHWLFDEMAGRRPVSMYAVPGHKTKAVVDKTGRITKLLGWKFSNPMGGKYNVPLDECMTFQLFDPNDRHGGLSPRQPAKLAIISDYNASLFNAAMFQNSCEPGTVLETEAPFNPEQDDQIRSSWQQRHGGPLNARKLSVMWGGLKHKSIAQSLKDMVYPQGKQLDREETCAAYRVPASVAGFFGKTGDSSAYVNAELERFWEDTEGPLLDKFGDAINVHFVPRFDARLRAWFDMEDVPIYQKLRRSRINTAKDLFAMARPWEDINDVLDLGMPKRPWDQVGFVSANLLPADQAASGFAMPPLNEGTEEEEPEGTAEPAEESSAREIRSSRSIGTGTDSRSAVEKAAMDQVWRAFERSFTPLAKRCALLFQRHFAAQQRQIIKLLRQRLTAEIAESAEGQVDEKQKKNSASSVTSAVKNPQVIGQILFEVFDAPQERQKFRARLLPVARDGWELGVRQSLTEAGMEAEALETTAQRLLANPRITEAVQSDAIRISTKVNAFTRNHLRRSLAEGLQEHEGIRELADRVETFMGGRRKAALTVARNSVGQSVGQARRQGRLAAGVTHEIWVHSRGVGERREAHVAAEARYRKQPKPINESFIINGVALSHPRDPNGPPAEVINCQCLALGKRVTRGVAADDTSAFVKLLVGGFYSYTDLLRARDRSACSAEDKDNG